MSVFRTRPPITRLIVNGGGTERLVITQSPTSIPDERDSDVIAAASSAGVYIYIDDVLVKPVPPPSGDFPVSGTAEAAADTPLVFRKGSDGIFRPEAAPTSTEPLWGDMVRFAETEPIDAAPAGVVHVDLSTGTVYRAVEV